MEEFTLHRAAKNGDLERVKHFVNLGQSVDSLDKCNCTPLHWAAKFGHVEVVEYLLQNNCDCNLKMYKAYNGTTAALLAAEHGHKNIVELFLRHGTDVNNSCAEFSKWTVLHHASRRGWTEIVHNIVKSGKAELDVKTCVGSTPLILATEEGHADIARILVQAGAQVNLCDADGWTALHYASKRGWLPIVKSIVGSKECNIHVKNSSGNTPLHVAYSMNNLEIVRELLKAGADSSYTNKENLTAFFGFPMQTAAIHGDLEELKHLIELGMSVDEQDEIEDTPLYWAAINGNFDVAEFLIQSNCNMNLVSRDNLTPLEAALQEGHKAVYDLLFQNGARFHPELSCDINLRRAAERGWLDVVRPLVESGEDVNKESDEGKTPLMAAAQYGRKDVAAYLIQNGADVNCRDDIGETALHYATERFLIRNGAGINCRDDAREIPFHYAVTQRDSLETVRVLLEVEELEIDCTDASGYTPVLKASRQGYGSVVKMLLKAGADFGIGKKIISVEEIKLLLQRGAYLKDSAYENMCNRDDLKEQILKDVEVCTQSIVNKFNNKSLYSLYAIPYFAKLLPRMDKLTLSSQQTEEIKKCVSSEIKTHTFCNIVDIRPNVLTMLCVQSLLSYKSTMKRNICPNFCDWNLPAKKPRLN